MASDPDSCIPDALKDFVFDLHDSVRTSQIASEQAALYSGTFRELTAKYFAQGPWPSPQSIASEFPNDPLFLALYRELTLRHHHSISRPTVNDRVDGWHAYRTLFDLLLAESTTATDDVNAATSSAPTGEGNPLYLLPEWTFDLLNEFVYQFQGFCQFRTAAYANASKYASSNSNNEHADNADNNTNNDKSMTDDKQGQDSNGNESKIKKKMSPVPHHVTESIDILSQNPDAWAVETVLFYLHRLVHIGTIGAGTPSATDDNSNTTATLQTNDKNDELPAPAFRHLSVFASVTLSRLECLLGDYTASLSALAPLTGILFAPPVISSNANNTSTHNTTTIATNAQLARTVFAARLSVSYHAGVSYLMLRRYRDATLVLGDMCAVLQRGFKSGRVHGVVGGEGRVEQHSKQYDRMIALLAILTHACPAGNGRVGGGGSGAGDGSVGGVGGGGSLLVEDSVSRVVGDRHRTQLSKIEAGEEGYEDLFIFACPKFISPAVPDYALLTGDGGQDAYKLQVRHFMNEMASQQTMRKLRSYMKLYTSISVEKLGRLVLEAEFEALLLSYKHKMRQIEVVRGTASTNDDSKDSAIAGAGDGTSISPLDGKVGTVMDIHYYIKDDVIHVDEAEKQNRFENYFVSQISQCNDIIKDVEAISVHI